MPEPDSNLPPAHLEARLDALEHRVGELEDVNAIRRLHWAYGYYIDFNLPDQVAELFAEDGMVVFLSGEYVGHAGVKRLYGDWIQQRFTGGKPGPVNGLLLDHFQMQDVITVAPDRQTAKGRFRGMLFGGWHDDFQDTREEIMPQQFMEAGIYENDYVREDGVWKIKRLDYMMQWQGDYEQGWAHTTSHLQPAALTFPEDPIGPDRLLPQSAHRPTWPYRHDVPMHFAHPRFGNVLAGQEVG
ncbi:MULTISPECIES: nuclear transport factor 2 family protein [unclassified Novosphingobium]|uniref:nuclear transport factor 2 family protein n=1 Tax=unclassified Novosphingobium TaxID=2644732 RepID=UPI0012CB3AAB|nr:MULTISPECIES: nuclear transport factor 2 family protein [unclassified Novosphingobium]MPS69725.1 nuclear transport factor 2 family protein [Novosphingobium sp.]WRT94982.1 nuclear transport factor 2 family protein [Novosphingobium sp. RL4]